MTDDAGVKMLRGLPPWCKQKGWWVKVSEMRFVEWSQKLGWIVD